MPGGADHPREHCPVLGLPARAGTMEHSVLRAVAVAAVVLALLSKQLVEHTSYRSFKLTTLCQLFCSDVPVG